ncbi:MAG: DUF115 domain-containing protein, partial [bacterium]|nr:DUF115 domain-containing protein [bacterium]
MNTTLKNNLTALASRDPAAAHAVKTASLKSNRLVMEQSRSGTDWTGYYQSNSGKKAYLASRYQPSREASKRVEHLDYQNKYLFVIIGFGLGYELREIMNRMHEQAVVIVIEPRPDLMRAALESIPLEDVISGRNLFWALGNKADIQAALQCHSLTLAQFLNSVEVFEHPVLKRHLEESYAGLLKMFFDAATYNIIAVGNDPQDTMLGIENAFNNFDAILSSPDISRYFATLTDRPAIVIMAGPSLDEQMPVLKTIDRDRALLLCADTILNKLLQEGIIPHLVFTLERGEVVYE